MKERPADHSMIALLTAAVVLSGIFYYISPSDGRAVMATPSAMALPPLANDSADVAATVERFHQALAAGDSSGALRLLAEDVQVLENGLQENRAEYRSHHLAADIEFARSSPSIRSPVRVELEGDVAWALATTTTKGQASRSAGAELMILKREGAQWKIAAIHWSSRPLP